MVGIDLHDQQTALMNLARLFDLLKVEMVPRGTEDDPIVVKQRMAARKAFIDALNAMEKQIRSAG